MRWRSALRAARLRTWVRCWTGVAAADAPAGFSPTVAPTSTASISMPTMSAGVPNTSRDASPPSCRSRRLHSRTTSSQRSAAFRCSRISTGITKRCGSPNCIASRSRERCCSCRSSATLRRRTTTCWKRSPRMPMASSTPAATRPSMRSRKAAHITATSFTSGLYQARLGTAFRDSVDRTGDRRQLSGSRRGAEAAATVSQQSYFAIRKFARFCAIEENTLLSSLAWLTL